VTDSLSVSGDDDPYQVRLLSPDELDKLKRELHVELIHYPVGTAARQRL
jgi:hypothetical protein